MAWEGNNADILLFTNVTWISSLMFLRRINAIGSLDVGSGSAEMWGWDALEVTRQMSPEDSIRWWQLLALCQPVDQQQNFDKQQSSDSFY